MQEGDFGPEGERVGGEISGEQRKIDQMRREVRAKIQKFNFFFNCFVCNNLILILSEVEGQFSHQTRKPKQ
jgi:transcription elongation factor Elf1